MANPKIQLRHDTKANWETVNPVLLQGEVAIETDTNRTKIGNGTSTYTELGYNINFDTNTPLTILQSQTFDYSEDIQNYPDGDIEITYRIYWFNNTGAGASVVIKNNEGTSIWYNRHQSGTGNAIQMTGASNIYITQREYYYGTLYITKTSTDIKVYAILKDKTGNIVQQGTPQTYTLSNVKKVAYYDNSGTTFTPVATVKYTNKLALNYDETTLGISDGKLTVINGDAGGTLQTQINGLQTQITNLENNPPTPSNMVTTNTAQTITTNKNFQYGLGLGTASHTLNRQIRVITNPTDTEVSSFTLPLVDVDRNGDVITFGSTNPNQSNRQIVFSTDAIDATTKVTFEANQPLVRNQMNPENEGTFTVYDTSMNSDIASISALKGDKTLQELTVLPTGGDYTLTDTGYFIVEGNKSGTEAWYFSVFMITTSNGMVRLGGMPTAQIGGYAACCVYGNKGTKFRVTYGGTGGNVTHIRFCPI